MRRRRRRCPRAGLRTLGRAGLGRAGPAGWGGPGALRLRDSVDLRRGPAASRSDSDGARPPGRPGPPGHGPPWRRYRRDRRDRRDRRRRRGPRAGPPVRLGVPARVRLGLGSPPRPGPARPVPAQPGPAGLRPADSDPLSRARRLQRVREPCGMLEHLALYLSVVFVAVLGLSHSALRSVAAQRDPSQGRDRVRSAGPATRSLPPFRV